MKKTLYMVILVITILIGTTLNNFTYAKGAIGGAIGGVIDGEESSSPQEFSTSGIVSGADDFISTGESNSGKSMITKDELNNLTDDVYTTLVIVGVVIAVIVGAVLAIKFITESVEGKAEVQKALIAYVIGCVVIFGAFTIWKIVVTVLQGV